MTEADALEAPIRIRLTLAIVVVLTDFAEKSLTNLPENVFA